jgi:hypothetical protein
MLIGVILGIVAFCLVSSFVQFATQSSQAAFFPGLIGGLWAAWPFIYKSRVRRYKFLHPVPREYAGINLQQAFSVIAQFLRDARYNFGDQWHVDANPAASRIAADLRFTEEEQHPEFGGRPFFQFRTKRVRRYLKLEALFKPTASNGTIVQLDFEPRVEGFDSGACNEMIGDVQGAIALALGEGEPVVQELSDKLPGPPNWLLVSTVAILFCLCFDATNSVLRTIGLVGENGKTLDQAKQKQMQQRQAEKDEFDSWKRFKESHNL